MTDQTASLSLPRVRPTAGSRTGAGASAGANTRAGGRISDLPWPVGLYLFVVLIPMSETVGPLVMTSLRLFLLIIVLPLMIRLLTGRLGPIRAPDLLFLAFVAWSAIAIGVNNPAQMVQFVGSTGLEFYGGYLMGRAYIRTPQAFMSLARTLVLLMLLTMPLAAFETLTGRSLLYELIRMLPVQTTIYDNRMPARLGLTRVQLTFAHPIHYGLFGTVAFSLAFVALKGQTTTLWRYVSSSAVGFCVFLSVSSGAVLALALQMLLILWAAVFSGFRWRWHLLLGLGVTGYLVVDLLSSGTVIEWFLGNATFNAMTAFGRAVIFEWGMVNVWGSPIFGIGLNDWVRPAYMFHTSVDNFWLLAAMRFGIPGFLLLAAGYLSGLVQVMRCDFGPGTLLSQLRLAWVFTFVGMTFSLATVALWTNIYSYVFFMFASGLWLTEARQTAGAAAPDRDRAPRRAAVARPRRAALQGPVDAAAAMPDGPRYTRFPPGDRPSGRGGGSSDGT